ncbi:acetylglutamate kinase [Bacillus dakarensis]|uniref:acetylglutamate kinase n=1 Tax=Robertmurraya dakarensis TaxID=1926278 RepID=UPI0009815EA5|nr:acetylglutamate kinase [Bacillus dakarensis]
MKKVLMKCGGSTLEELSTDFFTSLHELKNHGYAIIIVHGGGPDINNMLEQLNVEPEYVNGLRKTNEETFNVVEMVLSGKTNRKLVQKLTTNGLKAIGLNGSDLEMLKGDYVDQDRLGLVGDIQEVKTDILQMLIEKDIIPVITPIAITDIGQKLNVNADYAAAAVANALAVDHCLFVTDVEGIMIDGKVQESLTLDEVKQYIESGEIYGGMIPKVNSSLSAIEKGIESVRIVSGKKIFFQEEKWYGTQIFEKERVVK